MTLEVLWDSLCPHRDPVMREFEERLKEITQPFHEAIVLEELFRPSPFAIGGSK